MDGMTSDDAPMLIFHQCMDAEWLTWGRKSAEDFAKLGVGVVRVRTSHWRDLKEGDPAAFENPCKEDQVKQQMICTIMMRDVTVPEIAEITESMQRGRLPADMRKWPKYPGSLSEILLPEGDMPFVPCLDVVAVTEASALPSTQTTLRLCRLLYRQYSERLVWAGFNSVSRVTGSKLALGGVEDFSLLGRVFDRLKVWHVDQQYKSFQNGYFTVVGGKLHIVVGHRDHVSGCNDAAKKPSKMLGSSFMPSPSVQPRDVQQIACPDVDTFIRSSLRNTMKQRGAATVDDTVARRMRSYMADADPLKQDGPQ
jgi:hypothetical protein